MDTVGKVQNSRLPVASLLIGYSLNEIFYLQNNETFLCVLEVNDKLWAAAILGYVTGSFSRFSWAYKGSRE